MGIGSEDIELLIRLREAELLRPGGAIIEIGTQQLAPSFLLMTDRLKALGQLFGVSRSLNLPGTDSSDTSFGDRHLQSTAPFAREFWEWLGFEYAAVDIDGNPGSIPLDLNYDSAPWSSRKKFDLVTNFGTTEHVANHLNAFKLIHDLTAQGGIMVHRLPCQGMFNHGFVNYNFKFFWMLARSNGYKFIHADFTDSPEPAGLPTDIIDFLRPFTAAGVERARNYRTVDAAILAVLQKTYNMAFVPPIDIPTGTKTDIKSLKRRYWTVFEPSAFK